MSNITPQPSQPKSDWQINVDRLVPYRKQVAIALVVIGVAFAIYPIWLLIRQSMQVAIGPVFIWTVVMSLTNLLLGAVAFGFSGDGKMTEGEKLRVLLIAAGALLGLGLALLGFALPVFVYQETWAKGLESWREKPGALIWPALSLIGGLALMFVSLQLGRGMERQHAAVRRIIYGFNAVFMSLLLFAVLALPNVLAYADPFTRFFGRPFDWTATDVNSISPAMRNLLADLKEPVKIYVLLPSNNLIAQDTRTLLDNCRSLSSNLTWEFVDPRSSQNRTRLVGFMEKYAISDPSGLLIIRGDESEKSKSDHAFIKFRDLFSEDMAGARGGAFSYAYTGENALFNALRGMIEGKLVIYFSQGHGEFAFNSEPPAMARMRPRQTGGLSALKDKLSERKSVEVKALNIDRSLKKIPDDAGVLVVARPTQPFNPDELKVLQDYVSRQGRTNKVKDKDGREREEEEVTAGKLFLLLDPLIQKEGGRSSMSPTGLEPLLARFNVKVGNDRIETISRPDPLEIIAWTPVESANSVAKAFSPSEDQRTVFIFRNVRTVEPGAAPPPGGSGAAVDKLMVAPVQVACWVETDFDRDPVSLAERLRDADGAELRAKMLSRKDLCLAVAVSDSAGAAPRDAAHAGMLKDTPRMVVFGNAGWITEESLAGGRGTLRMDLFNSCISWLREKSSIGQVIPPKKRKEYELGIPPQEANKLKYLPLALMMLGIIGLGTGVWVVRRR
jgi:hypothetical protein